MDMDAQVEFIASNDLTQILKGKRTKRQRSSSPYKAAMTSTSSSGSGEGEKTRVVVVEEYSSYHYSSSPATSSHVDESTEEEDMANCLILLAQGDHRPSQTENSNRVEKPSARKHSDMAVATTVVASSTSINKVGFYVYECKTCNRSFPSFQALGGHRASHKKPKPTLLLEEKKSNTIDHHLVASSMDDDHHHHDLNHEYCQLNKSTADSLSVQIPNKVFHGHKAKIHECSICGSEFTSGQALGGHMRRHRANTNNQVRVSSIESNNVNCDENKPRNVLALDLNLPAPLEDDHHHHRESNFKFKSTQPGLVFSTAPALVDCHY